MLKGFADRRRGTRGQVVGKLGVAGTHAVGASTALAVKRAAGLVLRALLAGAAGLAGNKRGSERKEGN